MGYNTENGASLQKLLDKSQISEKRQQILLLDIKEKENKILTIFRNYSSRLARALSKIRAGRTIAVEEMFMRKLTKNYTYLEILVPYLNNTSEETIFGVV